MLVVSVFVVVVNFRWGFLFTVHFSSFSLEINNLKLQKKHEQWKTVLYKNLTFEQAGESPEVEPVIIRPSREQHRAPDVG